MLKGWRTVTLDELGEVNRGRSRHRPRNAAHLYGGDYPFIQTGDVKSAGGRITSHTQTYSEAGLAQSRIWPTNTMVITIAANIAETALLTYPACMPDSIIGFIANDKLCDVRFIEYVFRNLRRQIQHENVGTGTAQDNINLQTLHQLKFNIPTLAEQKAIASVLGALDDKIENNRQMNETLEEMARAIFKSWFVDFDPVHAKAAGNAPAHMDADTAALFPSSFGNDGLPVGWDIGKVEDIVDRQRAGKLFSKKTSATTGLVPVLDQSEADIIGFHNEEPSVFASPTDRVITFANHTCVLRLIDFNFSAIQNVIPFKGKRYPTEWVLYASQNKQKFEEYKGHWPTFLVQPTVLPDIKTAIIYANLVEPMVAKISTNKTQNQTLAELRDTLLPKLMSGEIRVKDAEREVEEAV